MVYVVKVDDVIGNDEYLVKFQHVNDFDTFTRLYQEIMDEFENQDPDNTDYEEFMEWEDFVQHCHDNGVDFEYIQADEDFTYG